jgi:uncharacterized protein (DUF2252 family)
MRDAVQEFKTFNRPFAERNHELIRFKIARMAESAFAFFRGSFHLYSHDVARQYMIPLPILSEVGTEMELVGDIHSENYGTYKADDGLIHYDLNDFDETMLGRLNFDVCRFAVNIVLGAQERKDTLETQTAAVLAGLSSYLQTVHACFKKGKFADLDISEKSPSDCEAIAQLIRQKSAVKRARFIADLTEDKYGKRQIKRAILKYFNLSDAEKNQAERLVQDFRKRWQTPLKNKNFFDIHDICGRISGIGSMGRYRYVVLITGKGHEDKHNVLLEFKEARPSPFDHYRNRENTPEALQQRAEKVIAVERNSQAACSAYLGHAIDGAMSFQVREISPHAGRVDLASLKSPADFIDVMKVQAAILARAHVRASMRLQGPTNPLPELADADRFRQRVQSFALGYADIAYRDWQRFAAARGDLENVAQWVQAT